MLVYRGYNPTFITDWFTAPTTNRFKAKLFIKLGFAVQLYAYTISVSIREKATNKKIMYIPNYQKQK